MSSGVDHLSRLLALVPWLRAHPGISIEEAAAEFGVSAAQLQKDLELLTVCGLPRQGPEDLIDISYWGDGIEVLDPQTISRPLRLAPDEAVALMVGLRLLRDLPGRHDPAIVDNLLAKLADAAGEAADPSRRVSVAVDTEQSGSTEIRTALAERRAMSLRYLVPSRDEVTERTVDPIRIIAQDGRSYLEAWCRRAEDVRLFRVDRIVGAQVLPEAASVPEHARTRDLTEGLFRPSPDDTVVTVQVTPEGRWLADYVPYESVTELAGGGLRVVLRTPDTRWVARLMLRLGGSGQVVDPPELADEVRSRAAALLAAHRAASPS
jgi:proteasome accessory factor C